MLISCTHAFGKTTYTHIILHTCAVAKKKKRKKKLFKSNTNYCREIKLIPINMDQCLLSFDAFKFSLESRLHGDVSLPNFNFFQCKSPNLTAKS